jgi:hypothetical protein
LTQERNYKVAAHGLCSDLLSETELRRLLSSAGTDEVIQRALRVVNATNLIFPNEKMALRDGLADSGHRMRFGQALYALLHGGQPPEERFLSFSQVLGIIGAAKWTVASYFPFVYEPSKPTSSTPLCWAGPLPWPAFQERPIPSG